MRMFDWYRAATPIERRTFWGCFCGWTLDSFDGYILAFLLPTLMATWHFSKSQAGLIATSSLLVAAVGGWVSGILSDRHGRVRILTWSIIWFTGIQRGGRTDELIWAVAGRTGFAGFGVRCRMGRRCRFDG